MKPTDLMSIDEVARVVAHLHRTARRCPNTRLTLAIVRLALSNLRAKELCGLLMRDVLPTGTRPAITVRAAITKGQEGKRRARTVPLWWDSGCLADIASWYEYRVKQGAGPDDPFLARPTGDKAGQSITTVMAARRWKTATAILGPERQAQLHIHAARHTAISHALAVGHSLVAVRDAAGHSDIKITSIYLHFVDRGEIIPDLYSI